jgi:hypothetical protein
MLLLVASMVAALCSIPQSPERRLTHAIDTLAALVRDAEMLTP